MKENGRKIKVRGKEDDRMQVRVRGKQHRYEGEGNVDEEVE